MKLLNISNFTFGHNVFKSRLLLLRQNASAGGRGLNNQNIQYYHSTCIYNDVYIYTHMSSPTRKPTFWTLALSIDPDQPKQAAHTHPDRHFSPPVDFLVSTDFI